jgi:hypothetical protein
MKYPNHVLLDIERSSTAQLTSNWTSTYKSTFMTGSFKKSLKKAFNNETVQVIVPVKSKKLYSPKTVKPSVCNNSLLWSLFDINFIKKEKIYTKLKYSRSPQYDIVSGGSAALFAGFLGFLISEKFGIELVDSGDFYTFFMYCVFFTFSLRPFLKILSKDQTVWHFFSYKFLLSYLNILANLSLKVAKRLASHFSFFVISAKFLQNNEYFTTIKKNFGDLITFLKTYPVGRK